MKPTFKSNLLAGFGLSLFLLVVTSVASYFSITNLISSSAWVDHTHRVITASEEVISNMKDGETGQRGYLLTKDIDFLAPFNGSSGRTLRAIDNLRSLTTDNVAQQRNCDSLEILANKRFAILQRSLDNVKGGEPVSDAILREGKSSMEQLRALVNEVQNIERSLLSQRTDRLKRFTDYTPVIIIAAAILSLLITIFFFKRVSDDFKEKSFLNEELERKDKEMASRISIIQNIAQEIAGGNYAVRLNAEENDELGSLSGSLNKMGSSLEHSFTRLEENEWLQTGAAQLSEAVAGEKDLPVLSADILGFVAAYTHSQAGAMYLQDDAGILQLASTFMMAQGVIKTKLQSGEGLVGQCFRSRAIIRMKEIDEGLYTSFSGGDIKSKDVIAFPLRFEGDVAGVIELGTIHSYRAMDLQYVQNIAELTGIAINTAKSRAKLKELLEETQSQSEELQSQHEELENMNTELEAQAEKLQTSEEELRVQQEELMETNQTLEERSRLLEDKNQLITIKNIEIQKKAEELTVSTRYKSEFLANMSHELRTPLNSILLLSRLLHENNRGNLNKEQVEYAQVIQSSGNSLLQLIDEILDLSKIESGKLELYYEMVPLEDIVNDMKMLFLPMAREKNIDFNIHVDTDVPAQMETDRLRLEQILKNLLSNALKFTARGIIELNIAPSTRFEGFIDFKIRDTGIGIAEEKQESIFEAFQQADGSTKRNYGGTGLGLSISRQLARLLSGDITLKSAVDKGSEFTVYIPLTKDRDGIALPDTAAEFSGLPAAAGQTGSDTPVSRLIVPGIPSDVSDDRQSINTGDRVLLIVEDDTSFAKALLDFVRQHGYKGVVVVRGDYALAAAKTYKPSGILLDIQLPVKDGLQVMDELKADPATRPIPVHIMSSFELKRETISKGAIDFINKPLLPEQMGSILEKIERTLKNKQKKVLIVEDNTQHAKALAYFLSNHGIRAEMSADMEQGMDILQKKEVNCVILDMGIPGVKSYETLDGMKKNESLANIPIIIFTGKNLSRSEEQRIKQYADSIVVKTAHSYQRILDEVSLFLHLMDEKMDRHRLASERKIALLDDVLKNKTVLVTDDDVRNIFALTKALEKHQMRVITAGDGKEALRALSSNPDVGIVLMDIMMPEMDGYESISRIRKNPEWKRLPVIAVTAKAMTGDREKCIQAGASDYITKPVDTDQLISLMRIWLQETIK